MNANEQNKPTRADRINERSHPRRHVWVLRQDKIEIKTKDIKVIPSDAHLGRWKKSWIFPVRVHIAIAIIIEAKNRINISFKFHKINMEMINAIIENNVVGFKLYIQV